MRVIVCENYDELSMAAARLVEAQMLLKPDCTLGLATGSTPIGLYNNLIELYKKGNLDFSKVTTFNLDEYYPISGDNVQSYKYFMNDKLFNHVNIDESKTHIPNGETKFPEEECANYDKHIEEHGGVDLQILGIGNNGHIGFNEPDENLVAGTHITGLTESTIEANSRFFDSMDEVPKKALTMGIGSILKSKKIILMASGKSKSDAVKALLDDKINTNIPATMLKAHSDVILICDKEAYGKED